MFEQRVLVNKRFGRKSKSSPETTRTEENKIAQEQALSEEQFNQIYDSYFSRLYNYVASRTSNREEAEDIVAFVFEQILNKFYTFNPQRGSLDSWVFTIAQNAIIDRLRYKRRHLEQVLDEHLQIEDDFSISEQFLKKEEIEQLRRFMSRLTERERELIRLRYSADLPHRRIGELMQMNEGNVAVTMRRILRKLYSYFEAEEARSGEIAGK